MGFSSGVVKVLKWRVSIRTLLNLLDCFKIMVTAASNRLGLLKPSEEITDSNTDSMEEHQHNHHPSDYILLLDRLSPSIVPVPIHVATAYIKKRLPVVEFGQVFERNRECENQDTVCSICLECIERRHEVREQRNCNHVFHRECLDRWINQGQVTCPLCRVTLFQGKAEKTSCRGNPWTMDGDAYLDRLEFIVG